MSHEAAPPPVPPAEESAADADPTVSRADFDQFSREYRPRLLGFVCQAARADGLSEARLDAEGVVQETFELALRQWATIQLPERWIYRVAARKVRHHSRQEWSRERELRRLLQAVSSEESDSDPAHTLAVAGDIIDLIMTLPTNQRIATYLHHVEQWTAAEIAEILDIAPATAYVHVHRGTSALRHEMRAYAPLLSVSDRGPAPIRVWPWVAVVLMGCLLAGSWIYRDSFPPIVAALVPWLAGSLVVGVAVWAAVGNSCSSVPQGVRCCRQTRPGVVTLVSLAVVSQRDRLGCGPGPRGRPGRRSPGSA